MTSLQLARLAMLLLHVKEMNLREMRWARENLASPTLHAAWNMAVIEESLWSCTIGVLDALPEEVERDAFPLFKPVGDDIVGEWIGALEARVLNLENIYGNLSSYLPEGDLEDEDYDYIDESLKDLLG